MGAMKGLSRALLSSDLHFRMTSLPEVYRVPCTGVGTNFRLGEQLGNGSCYPCKRFNKVSKVYRTTGDD